VVLKINERVFENVEWNVDTDKIGKLRYASDEDIPMLISEIGDAEYIESYEGDILLGKWINHGIESVRKMDLGQDGTLIEIIFKLTTINQSAEVALQTGIDDSVNAVLELARLYSSLEETYTQAKQRLDEIAEESLRVSRDADQKSDDMNSKYNERVLEAQQFGERIGALELAIARLNDRLATLPSGVVENFAAIDNRLNALADRIARIENRG
jgi:hypothetical protein